jgi:hypothetical protein
MNKLMGFYELKDSGLPSVPWRNFDESTVMDSSLLWTVRTATYRGEDLNLPRTVGKSSEEAYCAALDLYKRYKDIGTVIYYPYFIAEKSGTLRVSSEDTVIEAVHKDLWNLVTYNNKDVTIIINKDNVFIDGSKEFLSDQELEELRAYNNKIRRKFRDYMISGKTLLLEWSYAYNSDIYKKPKGDKYLVFYEIREI